MIGNWRHVGLFNATRKIVTELLAGLGFLLAGVAVGCTGDAAKPNANPSDPAATNGGANSAAKNEAKFDDSPKIDLETADVGGLDSQFVEYEIPWREVTLVVQAPPNGKIGEGSYGAEFYLQYDDGSAIGFHYIPFEKEERTLTAQGVYRPKRFLNTDGDVLIYEKSANHNRNYQGYVGKTVGPFEFRLFVERPEGSYGDDLTYEQCLLLLKAARTLRLKEEFPQEPIAWLKKANCRFTDTDDPAAVAYVAFNYVTPLALSVLERLPNVTSVSVDGRGAGRDFLKYLAKCPQLENLETRNFSCNDESLQYFEQLPQLTTLRIWLEPDVGPGMKSFAALKNLTDLKFYQFPAKGAGELRHLANAKNLEKLDINLHQPSGDSSRVGDAFAFLADLPNLKSLEIGGTVGLFDDELAFCRNLGQVEELKLGSLKIGDPGFAHLAGLKSVKSLSLDFFDDKIPVTAAGIQHLAGLENLTRLDIDDLPMNRERLAAVATLSQLEGFQFETADDIKLDDVLQLKALPNLKWITSYGIPLSSEEKEKLKQEMPNVRFNF